MANERVQTNAAGQVVLKLKTAWRVGTTHLVMSPLEFMQRLAAAETEAGADLPQFVRNEFDAFLECGILAHGFLRLRCGECGHDKLVAFSCKRRGFCPSCGARRMAQTAAHLVDHVIPKVPVCQWVLSCEVIAQCWRQSKFDPPCQSNIDPGMGADRMMVSCG